MKKSDLLELIKNCHDNVLFIINTYDISNDEKTALYNIYVQSDLDKANVEADELSEDQLKELYENYEETNENLCSIIEDLKQEEQEDSKHKVTRVIPEEEQEEETKKERKGLKTFLKALGVVALAVIIALWARSCAKNKEKGLPLDTSDTTTSEPTVSDSSEPVTELEESIAPIIEKEILSINDVDLTNDDDIAKFADKIKKDLKDQGIDISNEQAENAIKLVNIDELANNGGTIPFASREEIYNAAQTAGIIAKAIGSQSVIKENDKTQSVESTSLKDMINVHNLSLDINEFEDCKNANGSYNIFKLFDKCSKEINGTDITRRTAFAKLFNELNARYLLVNSICKDSTIGENYLVNGIFNASADTLYTLTGGRNLGPIYGDGPRADKNHPGVICIEELITYNEGTYLNLYLVYADYIIEIRNNQLTVTIVKGGQ